jgi:hypothetical protein
VPLPPQIPSSVEHGTTPIKHGLLQSDLDAANHTIINLNLSGITITQNTVGLGNVDNTSDANKPVSTAQAVAIALKEPAITAGTSAQFWLGNKTWQTYGALALQDGTTTLSLLSTISPGTSSSATVQARASSYGSSGEATAILQLDTAAAGVLFSNTSTNNASAGLLRFSNVGRGVIEVSNNAPILFGVNGSERMRIQAGLMVGTTSDPGIGNARIIGTLYATNVITDSLTVNGIVSGGHATASVAITYPSGCGAQNSSDFTTTAIPSAELGDAVIVNPPQAMAYGGSCYTAWVSAPGIVSVRLNNYTSSSFGAIGPGNFRITVLKP